MARVLLPSGSAADAVALDQLNALRFSWVYCRRRSQYFTDDFAELRRTTLMCINTGRMNVRKRIVRRSRADIPDLPAERRIGADCPRPDITRSKYLRWHSLHDSQIHISIRSTLANHHRAAARRSPNSLDISAAEATRQVIRQAQRNGYRITADRNPRAIFQSETSPPILRRTECIEMDAAAPVFNPYWPAPVAQAIPSE